MIRPKELKELQESHAEQIAALLKGDRHAFCEAAGTDNREPAYMLNQMRNNGESICKAAWDTTGAAWRSIFATLPECSACPVQILDGGSTTLWAGEPSWDVYFNGIGHTLPSHLPDDWHPNEDELWEFSRVQLEAIIAYRGGGE